MIKSNSEDIYVSVILYKICLNFLFIERILKKKYHGFEKY